MFFVNDWKPITKPINHIILLASVFQSLDKTSGGKAAYYSTIVVVLFI